MVERRIQTRAASIEGPAFCHWATMLKLLSIMKTDNRLSDLRNTGMHEMIVTQNLVQSCMLKLVINTDHADIFQSICGLPNLVGKKSNKFWSGRIHF